MSTLKVQQILHSDGTTTTEPSIPALEKRLVTAWVHFNGTGTPSIDDDYNVSSISDGGTGKFTVNFDTAMSNTNYVGAGSAKKSDTNDDGNMSVQIGGTTSAGKTISTCPIRCTYNASTVSIDGPEIYVIFFGGR